MDIVVRLAPEKATYVRDGASSAGMVAVESLLAEFGAELSPQFPGIEDADLATFYLVSGVPDEASERVLNALLELDEVDAAYAQPTPFPA